MILLRAVFFILAIEAIYYSYRVEAASTSNKWGIQMNRRANRVLTSRLSAIVDPELFSHARDAVTSMHWQTAIDNSLLGPLLRQTPKISDLHPLLESTSLSKLSTLSTDMHDRLFSVTSSIRVPHLEFPFRFKLSSFSSTANGATAAAGIREWVEGNSYLKLLDIAQLPFLDENMRQLITEQLPAWQRILLGFIGLDVIPLGIDALIVKQIFGLGKGAPLIKTSLDIDPSGLPLTYDVNAITAFYRQRPQIVVTRLVELLSLSSELLLGLFADRSAGTKATETNAPERAKQLRKLITKLGPAFVKVGQAISVRPDILSEAYLEELVLLQDQVPPFDSALTQQILARELHPLVPIEVFEDMGAFASPVAAARLVNYHQTRSVFPPPPLHGVLSLYIYRYLKARSWHAIYIMPASCF